MQRPPVDSRPEPVERDRIHRALIELCYEQGFENLTIPQLCAAAGIKESRFHASYLSLDDCFAEAYQKLAVEFLASMGAAFESGAGWREQLRAVAHAVVRYLHEDPARAHFTLIDCLNAGERAQLVRDSVFSSLFPLIDRGRNEPGAPSTLTAATAESIGGAVFLRLRETIEVGDDLTEVVPELMYSVVLPYLGPKAAAEELAIPVPSPPPSP